MKPLPTEKLTSLLAPLEGKRVLITGPNGFVGRWMLETLKHADVGCRYELATRDSWPSGQFDYVAHCTTDGVDHLRAYRLLSRTGRMLLLSSGAVYENRLQSVVDERSPLKPYTDYGKLKLRQESDCQTKAVICRLFGFVGPGLRRHIGREFLTDNPIAVTNGSAVRSWLYAGELAKWLWTALLRGETGRAYNVGSQMAYRVSDLAKLCAEKRGVDVVEKHSTTRGTTYVPDTRRAQNELNLHNSLTTAEAIERTLAWMRS